MSQKHLGRADRRLRTSYGELHLRHETGGVPEYRDLQPPVEFELGGERIQVATLETLRAMKRAAGRVKDRIDLAELDALERPS